MLSVLASKGFYSCKKITLTPYRIQRQCLLRTGDVHVHAAPLHDVRFAVLHEHIIRRPHASRLYNTNKDGAKINVLARIAGTTGIYLVKFWMRPPQSRYNFLHFHAVFRKIWPNNRLALPGKSWIRPWGR